MNDPSPESALAECPFCGEQPSTGSHGHDDEGYYFVECTKCRRDRDLEAERFVGVHAQNMADAIALWNKRTHGAHFAALARDAELVRSGLRNRGEYIEGQPPLPLALVAYDHMKLRAERAEAERDAAIAMLREAVPFVGWTGCPDGMIDRICAILGDKGEG